MSGDFVPIFDMPEIDRALLPVLPVGWLGIVEGSGGAGTHLIAKQAAHAAAGVMPVFYYATHESADEVARLFDEFGWDPGTVTITAQRLREIAVYRARAKGLTLSDAIVSPGTSWAPVAPSIAGRLLIDIAPLDAPFRFVLDSFDLLLDELDSKEITTLVQQIRHRAYTVGGGAILVLQPDVAEPRTRALMEVIADFILHLDLVPDGNGFYPRIVIRKVRNHPELTHTLRGTVTPRGMEAHD